MISPNDKNRKWVADWVGSGLGGFLLGMSVLDFRRGETLFAVISLILGLLLLLTWLFSEKLFGKPKAK